MVAVFALSLGNHLTAAAVAPAILVFVCADRSSCDRVANRSGRGADRDRGSGAVRFILIRTAQNAPYLEARASNLRELFAVVRASRFSDQIFAFSFVS